MAEVPAAQVTVSSSCSAAGCGEEATVTVRGLPFCELHAGDAQELARRVRLRLAPNGAVDLEERRRLVHELVEQGWSHRQIADRMRCSKTTVKSDLRPSRPTSTSPAATNGGGFETRALVAAEAGRRLDEALAAWRSAVRELSGPRKT
jgi:hypothetical protein